MKNRSELLVELKELGVPIGGLEVEVQRLLKRSVTDKDLVLLAKNAKEHGVPEGLTVVQVAATIQHLHEQ